MILTFSANRLFLLLGHILDVWTKEGNEGFQTLYDRPETKVPGLWLVGDEGVYLMDNCVHHLPKGAGGSGRFFVVYADQVDPGKMPFDDWWANKNDSFGGYDGVEFIELSGPMSELLSDKLPLLKSFSIDFGNSRNNEVSCSWSLYKSSPIRRLRTKKPFQEVVKV